MKTFNHVGIVFGVQAYLKNDFVNIAPLQKGNLGLDETMWTVKIEFCKGNKMTHGGKDNTAMKKLLNDINPEEVKSIVDSIFYTANQQ